MRRWAFTVAMLLAGGISAAACGSDETASGGNSGSGAGQAGGGDGGDAGGGAPSCGDGTCGSGETCDSCSLDCGSCCGNDSCDANELCGTCPADCGACTGDPFTVLRGPYLQRGAPDAVVVRWRTLEPRASAVAYGLSAESLSQVVVSDTPTTEHELTLTGLLPSTKFVYAYGAPDSVLVGGDDHFVVTPPPTGTSKPTRIWVIGDSGTANGDARDVRDAYLALTAERGTDLWLMLGDNAYNDGTDSEYQAAVFDMYPTLLSSVVLWSTLGNHDGHSADSGAQSGPYYDIFTLPTQGESGGVASGTEAYYAFDYGDIHFVCLDSYDSDTDPAGDMLTWLTNDLAANELPWLIAFWHHPPYTKGSHDSDSEGRLEDMRVNALPLLEQHGVDLILTGHSHSYERSMYLSGHYGPSNTLDSSMIVDAGDGRSDGDGAYTRVGGAADGAVYIVAGSSGKTSGGSLDHPAMFVSLNELGSVIVDVDGASMDVRFVDETGGIEDYFSIQK